jgi:hypothetical protein
MTAAEIIEAIKRLPKGEQAKVIEFARRAAADSRPPSPEESGKPGKRKVEAKDPAGADPLQEEIVRGFYDGQSQL